MSICPPYLCPPSRSGRGKSIIRTERRILCVRPEIGSFTHWCWCFWSSGFWVTYLIVRQTRRSQPTTRYLWIICWHVRIWGEPLSLVFSFCNNMLDAHKTSSDRMVEALGRREVRKDPNPDRWVTCGIEQKKVICSTISSLYSMTSIIMCSKASLLKEDQKSFF